jgi:hypothetical protein
MEVVFIADAIALVMLGGPALICLYLLKRH